MPLSNAERQRRYRERVRRNAVATDQLDRLERASGRLTELHEKLQHSLHECAMQEERFRANVRGLTEILGEASGRRGRHTSGNHAEVR